MSSVKVAIEVSNTREGRFEQVEVRVRPSATFAQLPGSILRRLGVPVRREVQVVDADGAVTTERLGEATIRLQDNSFVTPVLFCEEDEEPILGTVALMTSLLSVDEAKGILVPICARR